MIDVAEIEVVGTIRAYRNTSARRACEQTKVRIPFDMSSSHVPVLAAELIELIEPQPGDVVVDCTFGAGGHAALIAGLIGPAGRYIAIDRDPAAAGHFSDFAAQAPCRVRLIQSSFADGLALLREEGLKVDIVFADFGMSSMQIDTWGRGFSYSYDAPLDMRMDPEQELDAAEIVNSWDVDRIAKLLREYGDERYAKQIARAIDRERAQAPITTTSRLVEIVSAAIPAAARFGGGHPAKRSFQAIRIAVNDELGQIDAALPIAWDLLGEDGRFAGISFHSLEDRRVKGFLVARAEGCICPPDLPVCGCGRTPEAELLNRRAIAATPGEVESNPRAASARLRGARKVAS
jgi:16S rRNA (cytosine1402-N4)-methyltransferase